MLIDKKYIMQLKEVIQLMNMYKVYRRYEFIRVIIEAVASYVIVHYFIIKTPFFQGGVGSAELWTAVFFVVVSVIIYAINKIRQDLAIRNIEDKTTELYTLDSYLSEMLEGHTDVRQKGKHISE